MSEPQHVTVTAGLASAAAQVKPEPAKQDSSEPAQPGNKE